MRKQYGWGVRGWGASQNNPMSALIKSSNLYLSADKADGVSAGINSPLTNPLENIANKISSIKPIHIEGFASFCNFGIGVPIGIANYTGGNYFLNVTGNIGDAFVTVTSGNIAHAGDTRKWAGVIKDDLGRWYPYRVIGTDGVSVVNLDRPLKSTITNGELANVHDAALGQHYTERGYFALAQHLFYSSKRFSERNIFLHQFKATSATGPWVKVGNPFETYNLAQNSYMDGFLRTPPSPNLSYYIYANGTTQGTEWQVNLNKKQGFLETFIGERDGKANIRVEFYLDNVLVETKSNIGSRIERLTFAFQNAITAKIKIFIENASVEHRLRIGDTTWWLNELYLDTETIKQGSKVVYIGDSWGTFHNKAITRELATLINEPVINVSMAGHTSKWANEWFDNLVVSESPDYAIIEFFVNDRNSANGVNVGTYIGTDGQTKDMNVTYQEWRDNIKAMCDKAIANNVIPIVVGVCGTDSESQSQSLFNESILMFQGSFLHQNYANCLLQTFAGTTADGYVTETINGKTNTYLNFDGLNSFLQGSNHPNVDIVGTGDFWIAGIFKTKPTLTNQTLVSKSSGGAVSVVEANPQYALEYYTGGDISLALAGAYQSIAPSGTLQPNTLYGILVYRVSGVLKTRLNKIQISSLANTRNLISKPHFRIGARASNLDGTTHLSFSNSLISVWAMQNSTFDEEKLIKNWDKVCASKYGL
jgi:hypothetical protein